MTTESPDLPRANLAVRLRALADHRWAIPAVAWIAYAAAYPMLRDLLGTHAGVAAFVPVIATAWRTGA